MAGIELDGANQKVVLDADGDTYLEAATDDTVKVYVAGAQDFTITANTLTAESGSTIAAQALTATTVTASGIIKTDNATEATSTTDGSLQTDGGLSVVKDAVFGDDVKLLSDSSVVAFGADGDTTLTHTDGTGLTLNSTNKLCFNDATQFIQGASGTVLDIAATDEIELTATLLDVNANLDVSGTSLLPTLGVITAKDLGSGIHIRASDSSASANSAMDLLVIEKDSDAGMSILSSTSAGGYLAFGDSGDNDIGKIAYDHNNNRMDLTVNAALSIRMLSTGTKELYQTTNQRTMDVISTVADFSSDMALYYSYISGGTGFQFLTMRSNEDASPDTEFDFRGDGNAYADASWNASGADYAEYFETKTGNTIAVGKTLVLDGNKVRESTDSDATSTIIGVVRSKNYSKNASIVGNNPWDSWKNKYLTNDFGEYEMEEYTLTQWNFREGTDNKYENHHRKDTGKIVFKTDYIPSDVTPPGNKEVIDAKDKDGNKLKRRKLNSSWNKDTTYFPRENRDEWIIVGLLGQVQITKGQKTGDRWIKMKDISETVEEWYIR